MTKRSYRNKKNGAQKKTPAARAKAPETPPTWDTVDANLVLIETLVAEALAAYGATRSGIGWATVKYLPDVLSDIAFRLRVVRSFATPKSAEVHS